MITIYLNTWTQKTPVNVMFFFFYSSQYKKDLSTSTDILNVSFPWLAIAQH